MENYNPTQTKKLYISCLPSTIQDSTVIDYFSQFGTVTFIDVKRDETDQNRCTGFCQMTCSSLEMSKTILGMRHKIQGKTLKITPFYEGDELVRYRELINTCRIYVKNLPLETTDEELKLLFLAFGNIIDAYCVKKKRYPNKKFGYVIFEDPESINKINIDQFQFKGNRVSWYQTKKSKKNSKEGSQEKEEPQVEAEVENNMNQVNHEIVVRQREEDDAESQIYWNLDLRTPSEFQDRSRRMETLSNQLFQERLRYYTPPEAVERLAPGTISKENFNFNALQNDKRILKLKHNSKETLMQIRYNHRVSNIRFNWVQNKQLLDTRRQKNFTQNPINYPEAYYPHY